jgi:hypothetical protein
MKTPDNAVDKFEKFIAKEKFVEDSTIHYPGIMDEKMRPLFSERINKIAINFKKVALSDTPTDEDYLLEIKKGLGYFSDMYSDSEDQERIANYIEELMNIVGLETSEGQLNNFVYGFDPTKVKKE